MSPMIANILQDAVLKIIEVADGNIGFYSQYTPQIKELLTVMVDFKEEIEYAEEYVANVMMRKENKGIH